MVAYDGAMKEDSAWAMHNSRERICLATSQMAYFWWTPKIGLTLIKIGIFVVCGA